MRTQLTTANADGMYSTGAVHEEWGPVLVRVADTREAAIEMCREPSAVETFVINMATGECAWRKGDGAGA